MADGKHGELLGGHLVGHDVSELLPELTLAQKWDLTATELARNVHTHRRCPRRYRSASTAWRAHDQLLSMIRTEAVLAGRGVTAGYLLWLVAISIGDDLTTVGQWSLVILLLSGLLAVGA
ncbi:pyridine nucleotide-disulfide oxidoreductase, dimerization domain protein, partial [Mycobacterium ulcerans str. Harvey]